MIEVAVIGAGPAGMMAAIAASNDKTRVTIFEKNKKLGKKLAITGKGRCNLTNNRDVNDFLDQINSNPYFMYSSFYSFTNQNLMNFFESRGLELKVERGDRVFPKSDNAFHVIDVLRNELKYKKVNVIFDFTVNDITKNKNQFIINKDENLRFDKLIIATGGISYPTTGSTGFGYKVAEGFGHNIIKPKAALVPLELSNKFETDLRGLSLKNISLSLYENGKKIDSKFGEMLFTHFGISGPIVLTLSHNIKNKASYTALLDLKPALDEKSLDNRLLRDFEKYKNKSIKNALSDVLLQKLIIIVLKQADIDEDIIVNQLSKEKRKELVKTIKNIKLKIHSLRPIDEAIITSGGIDVDQIDPSRMESKLVKNLYFAGEVIDVDANTGGFNLQIAFSTGYLAGISCKEEI